MGRARYPFIRWVSVAPDQPRQQATHWERMQSRLASVSIEHLFGRFAIRKLPELMSWWQYIAARYPWVVEQ